MTDQRLGDEFTPHPSWTGPELREQQQRDQRLRDGEMTEREYLIETLNDSIRHYHELSDALAAENARLRAELEATHRRTRSTL